ncbi:MAG: DNA polymerase III subunit delta [Acidobacteria bacterium]|nr:DNA polymerase III subunit delta [Acidobacteriota bacterium]
MTNDFIPALRIQKVIQKEVSPAYLLLGSDPYLKQYVVSAFEKRIDPELRKLNVARFTEAEFQVCLDTARTLPMMAPQRLVILEDVSKLKEADWRVLYAYLEERNGCTILLLITSGLHPTRINKIARVAAVVSTEEPDLAEARSMVEKSFRKDGYELGPRVVDELLDQIGTSMQALVGTIEKLKLFRLQEKTVSFEDVAALSSHVRSHEIWDLTDQMAMRNRRRLLLLLDRMLARGAVPLVLLKSIYSHFAGLLVVKELAKKTTEESRRGVIMEAAVSKGSGMNPYYVRRLLEQSRSFRLSELTSALRELHRTDGAFKRSALPEKLLLETVLIRITSRSETE